MGTRKIDAYAFVTWVLQFYMVIQSPFCVATEHINPGNSGKRYIGIWYKQIPVRKVVWVANREKPLTASDTTYALTIGVDGNLRLVDGNKTIFWLTTVSTPSNNSVAVLLGEGNFVLRDSVSGDSLWQSFHYPCDTVLPGMMIGMDSRTGEKSFMSSWKAEDDPFPGIFVAGISPEKPPQAFIWKSSIPYWRSGPWNEWNEGMKNWNTVKDALVSACDAYGACGPFGVCNKNESPICRCLKGFEPKSYKEWGIGNWTSGCVRRTKLLCDKRIANLSSGSGKIDGFWKFRGSNCLIIPSLCRLMMLHNQISSIFRRFRLAGGSFLRLANLELGYRVYMRWTDLKAPQIPGQRYNRNHRFSDIFGTTMFAERGNLRRTSIKQQDPSELPMFDHQILASATNKFNINNKLGEGGFGPVFKSHQTHIDNSCPNALIFHNALKKGDYRTPS
ncbi:S-locus lectin protein kinase family protein [Actinidia rufa]|uniref:S-locus lectin protein kinase family protein n=1 Tax=Actinidia rufa TaxID=165716 RepID=A0A7J0FWS8_9ERIC|nr:S-locus lectin protein kinase family protein [Actinidia rufa]